MSEPRGIEERIDWFLSHTPASSGMCAQHTWHSLGGNNGNPPAWGCSDANECVDKVKSSGRYWTPASWDGPPPRGAWVGWKYGNHGHAALSNGDGKITTTDPSNGKSTGTEPLDYPKRWGFNDSNGDYTVWTDEYNNVRFEVGEDVDVLDYDYLDKPDGTFTITREYKTLDKSEWNPPRGGWENTQVYLNIDPTFKSGKTHGAIRVRLMREDGDDTGHEDIPIDIDDLDDNGRTLRRWNYWELGEKGASTKVQVECIGGLESCSVGTRYTKKAVVVQGG